MMKNLVARNATAEDLPWIKNCISESYSSYTQIIGRTPFSMRTDFFPLITSGEVYLLKFEDNLIGMVVLSPKEDHLYLGNMAVIPVLQGEGYGKFILNFSEQIAISKGFEKIQLFTSLKLNHLHEFYRKWGYIETHQESDLIFFCKKIGSLSA